MRRGDMSGRELQAVSRGDEAILTTTGRGPGEGGKGRDQTTHSRR